MKYKKPETHAQWRAFTATLSCQIGIDCIDGNKKPPAGATSSEWGIYNLLQAVKSLAEIHLEKEESR